MQIGRQGLLEYGRINVVVINFEALPSDRHVLDGFKLRAPDITAMAALQRLAVLSYCLRRCALP
jgi:hypothetical protein